MWVEVVDHEEAGAYCLQRIGQILHIIAQQFVPHHHVVVLIAGQRIKSGLWPVLHCTRKSRVAGEQATQQWSLVNEVAKYQRFFDSLSGVVLDGAYARALLQRLISHYTSLSSEET